MVEGTTCPKPSFWYITVLWNLSKNLISRLLKAQIINKSWESKPGFRSVLMTLPLHLQLPRVMSTVNTACLSVHSSSSHRLKAGPSQSSQPALLRPLPRGTEALSPTVWWCGASCHCLTLLKGNAVGFLCRVLKRRPIGSHVRFYLVKCFSHFIIRVPFQSLNLQLCGKLFCNERSLLRDWAAFNKVYVCILPYVTFAFFSTELRHPEAPPPPFTHMYVQTYVHTYIQRKPVRQTANCMPIRE